MTCPLIRQRWFLVLTVAIAASAILGGPRDAPPGLFKDVNDTSIRGAILLQGKQLFVDDHLIDEIVGARKRLNQPVKHPQNPLLVKDKPWEETGPGYGTVHYDAEAKQFKMWYTFWRKVEGTSTALLGYAVSQNGIDWTKPNVSESKQTNLLRHPPIQGFQNAGIFKDPVDRDPNRRYKMLFSCNPDSTPKTWRTSVAFSPDGLSWDAAEETALIPFSDTQICPLWDQSIQRYVAILRFGPPNTRMISRIQSEDFIHWSPKITVLRWTKFEEPQKTQFYQMAPMPYAGGYVGVLGAYHHRWQKPVPPDQPWTDRQDLHLVYSRNGVTWSRVGGRGAIPHEELSQPRNWKQEVRDATFVPYGRKDKDWDWGFVLPYFTPDPIVVDDRIYFYYAAQNARHFWMYSGDPPEKDPNAKDPNRGVGLATLRLDGFVSIEAGSEGGTMTTRPFVFLGDTLELNADATDGVIVVDALDGDGNVISGFSRAECVPITSDNLRHSLSWAGHENLHQLQGPADSTEVSPQERQALRSHSTNAPHALRPIV